MSWDKYLVPCKNFGKKRSDGTVCHKETHFKDALLNFETFERERLGLCRDCYDDFRKTPEYEQFKANLKKEAKEKREMREKFKHMSDEEYYGGLYDR